MKIIQVTHALTYGDAASNQVVSLDKLFKAMKIESEIYAGKIDPSFVYPARKYADLIPSKEIVLIYHFSTGTSFVKKILKYPYPIVLYYHNITPARFFFGNAWGSFIASLKGRKQLIRLREKAFFAWAASEYSRQELEDSGFTNTSILPILIDFEAYKHTRLNQDLITKFNDSLNLLCVGRVTPHKKQEDAIRTLYYYKNFINNQSRLFIVGGAKKNYLAKLKKLSKSLGLENDVIFTGKISFDDLCTYYRIADAFISMSEHEGFCVPLIESMLFEKPVFAFDSTAVPYTLGESGILFNKKNPALISEIIHHILDDEGLRQKVIAAQNNQLREFTEDNIIKKVDMDIRFIMHAKSGGNYA